MNLTLMKRAVVTTAVGAMLAVSTVVGVSAPAFADPAADCQRAWTAYWTSNFPNQPVPPVPAGWCKPTQQPTQPTMTPLPTAPTNTVPPSPVSPTETAPTTSGSAPTAPTGSPTTALTPANPAETTGAFQLPGGTTAARPTGPQSPTTAQAPTSGQAPPTSDANGPDRTGDERQCVPSDPKTRAPVSYSAPPELAAAAAQAGGAWSSAGSAPISAAPNGSRPTVQIKAINDPKKNFAGQFDRGSYGEPDQVTINFAVVTPAEAHEVIAHEMGHALGLSDSKDGGSLMGFGQGLNGVPQASDIAALRQVGCGPGFDGPQKQVWGACGIKSPADKVVRAYPRAAASYGNESIPAGESKLYCGTSSYGYFHFKDEKAQSWQDTYWNRNWRDSADAGIADALANPSKVKYEPPYIDKNGNPKGNKWIYCSLLWEKNYRKGGSGELTGKTMWSNVVIRSDRDDAFIVTAYPTENGLC